MKDILIFTDGASKGNPGPGGWGAVLVKGDSVTEIGAGKKNTTNNEMELRAVVTALESVPKIKVTIHVYSDSKYVVDGATGWVFGWLKNGWQTKNKTDVLHKELWQGLVAQLKMHTIEWHKIPGHVDLIGNECADRIASNFAEGRRVSLYDGPLKDYGHDIRDTSYDEEKAGARSEARKRQGQKAYSYISLLEGKVKTHATWAECEKRVKGKQGARFKKALTKAEEQEIIKEFNRRA